MKNCVTVDNGGTFVGEMTELAEGARLEIVCRFTPAGGSNPPLSAIFHEPGELAERSKAADSKSAGMLTGVESCSPPNNQQFA